jgi:hypothetical protein
VITYLHVMSGRAMNGTGDSDEVVRTVTAWLPSGVAVKVEAVTGEASADGMTSVGLRHLNVADALESVGEIGALVVSKLRRAKPSKTTVELKLGFAVESGKLTALWVGGKGEAALTVTLEWSGGPDGGPGGEAGPGEARAGQAGGGGEGDRCGSGAGRGDGSRSAGPGSGPDPGDGSAVGGADG